MPRINHIKEIIRVVEESVVLAKAFSMPPTKN